MSNGYHRNNPKHGTTVVNTPPGPPAEASAQTLQMQYDQAQARAAGIEAKLDKALKREDTGVHRVNTEALHITLRGDVAKIMRKWALLVAATLGIPLGSLGVREWMKPPPEEAAAAVSEQLEAETKQIEEQVEQNRELAETANKNVRTLGREVVRRDKARAEQLDYVTDIVLEGNPQANRVEPPPSVKKRREKKKTDALDEEVDDIFGPNDEEAPLR